MISNRMLIRIKAIATYLLLLISAGCHNLSNILPTTDFKYLEGYHCWPYDVKVYTIDEVKVDSLFFTYPLNSFFGNNQKYKSTTWKKYSEIDTTEWYGMDETLEQCDENNELYTQRLKGGDLYYSGQYQYILNRQGERRRTYERILFLDINKKKLHIFKDINKVF
jgi:hypothetical protein